MSLASANTVKPAYAIAAVALRTNQGQWKAYESQGNCVVLAGPGSGKTKTLTIKMARMLAEDVKAPRGIACITYNNQCARELKRRLAFLGVENGRRVSIGTLHSFCLQHIILPYARLAGIAVPEPLKVAMKAELDRCWTRAVERVKGTDEPPVDWIFRCEVYRRTHLDRDKSEWYGDHEDVAKIVEEYEEALQDNGLVDFDTIILIALQLIERHEWVRRALRSRFPILVVDEYQDLGLALHRIVLSLCFKANMRLLAVGDPDQSIYGFAGADPTLLQDLAKRDGVEPVRLQLNYRCGPTIIRASEVALGEARGFKSGTEEAGTLDIYERPLGLEDQASFVCDSIIRDALGRRDGRQLGDIAILYRDRYDGDVVAKAVEDRGWDFIRIDQGNPYPRSPIVFWLEDCAAWCAEGWKTGSPRLSELIWAWSRFNESVVSDAERLRLKRGLVNFLHSNRDANRPLRDWLSDFRSVCLDESLRREPRLRDDNAAVKKLSEVCAADTRLAGFTVCAFGGQCGSGTHLNLMTLHSAKGLEFDIVVMMGLEEGRLPNYRATTEPKLQEERRLFYVGLTRARHEVHLVYSGWYRTRYGVKRKGASRFVDSVALALTTTADEMDNASP
ncbi:MAG: ATP-dependent helicase [Chloroflexota bacterium]|nr:MAG: ATP-dependent helicase [Chloroflexota bacterium]